jgi:MoxR-like ATPase
LAKTLLIKTIAGVLTSISSGFMDLMPSDITGPRSDEEQDAPPAVREGTNLAQIILADEINRTPPKTQAHCSK